MGVTVAVNVTGCTMAVTETVTVAVVASDSDRQ